MAKPKFQCFIRLKANLTQKSINGAFREPSSGTKFERNPPITRQESTCCPVMMLRGTVASVHGRNEPFVRVVFKGGQLLLDVIKGFFEENSFRSARVDGLVDKMHLQSVIRTHPDRSKLIGVECSV